jgi:hypothetical protein
VLTDTAQRRQDEHAAECETAAALLEPGAIWTEIVTLPQD